MIEKDFSTCPRNLWITLWANGAELRQVLDFPHHPALCPISRQPKNLMKINDLTRISGESGRHELSS
jgi:hypothetical protein